MSVLPVATTIKRSNIGNFSRMCDDIQVQDATCFKWCMDIKFMCSEKLIYYNLLC